MQQNDAPFSLIRRFSGHKMLNQNVVKRLKNVISIPRFKTISRLAYRPAAVYRDSGPQPQLVAHDG